MALWADKYQPKALDKFVLHKGIADNLRKLVATGDYPHTLFYGPPGAGKRTLVMALLREIYGPGAEKIRVETKPWVLELPSRKLELELTTVSSNYHVELSPGDVGGTNDRYVVQEVIKDLAKNRPLDVATGAKGFKVLVLNEVDRLSREAQQSLRRTMEKYSAGCRLVMTCANVSKVMDPVRSRCLCVRVAAPPLEVVQEQLFAIAKKENLQLPAGLAARVAAASQRDLRRALLTLEVCRVQQYPFRDDQAVAPADWEAYVAEIAGDILQEQSAKRLYQVRGKLYELLANCIPPELLVRSLLLELLKKLDDELKPDAVALAAQYEHRLQEGQKAIFHLEAFVAQFMSRYKAWQLTAFG
ncbi:MAG: DNA replication factor C complex subunit 3 [Monoraphidium minutum]|nr:MAG: DNA replication factor C complex subunit 3 [Monoraphidium minutum]